jgi:hypothetical protein
MISRKREWGMVAVAMNVRNQVRNLLGIRRERKVPRRTPKPSVGARIFRDDVRMVVQAGLDRELWGWLQDQGWREVMVRPDRRLYREVPSSWVTLLIDSSPEQREAVLKAAVSNARAVPNPQTRRDP